MDTLSVETLHRIFTKLYTLQRDTAYSTIEFFGRINTAVKFIEMIAQSPHSGAQVKEIRLRNSFDSSFIKRNFCNLFPNARVIEVIDTMECYWEGQYIYYRDPITVTHSKSSLKYVKDNFSCELASQILFYSLCGKFQSLDLDFNGKKEVAHNILAQMIHLPVLRRLSISDFEMEIYELKALHQYVPSIQVLSIINVDIATSNILLVILPTSNLTAIDVSLRKVEDLVTLQQLFHYMAKKYINVNTIDYGDDILLGLTTYEAETIYSDGFIDFLQLIVLKECEFNLFNVPNSTDIFKPLDAAGCRFEDLEFFGHENSMFGEQLAQSKQFNSIRTLSLHDTVREPPNVLKRIMSLTSISIQVDQDYPMEPMKISELVGFHLR